MNERRITPQKALRLAVQFFPTQKDFAEAIGKSPARVSQILSDPLSVLPDESVITVERVTGIKRSLLRPDLYPPEEGGNA